MNDNIISALEEQFKSKCKVINLKYEYAVDRTSVQWAIISALSKEDIEVTFPEQVSKYLPFIVLTPEMGEAIQAYNRNENKHFMRRIRSEQLFDFVDGETESHHTELQEPDFSESIDEKDDVIEIIVHKAFDSLTEIQKSRIVKYFYENKSVLKIAHEEGKNDKSVSESIEKGLEKMKKVFDNTPEFDLSQWEQVKGLLLIRIEQYLSNQKTERYIHYED